MSEINGQTDDVALLVNWFFCSPFPPYENLKVDMAAGGRWGRGGGAGGDAGSHWSGGGSGEDTGTDLHELHFFVSNAAAV